MELKQKLEKIFNYDYPGTEHFIADVIEPIFGNEIEYKNDDLAEREEYAGKAAKAGIKKLVYVADITEQNYSSQNIAFFDVTLDNSVNVERARVNIQQLIRSVVGYYNHILIVFHFEETVDKSWRLSYAHKIDSQKNTTSAKRYTYVFGRGYRGRTAAERFVILEKSQRRNEDFEKAFSVAALSDDFFKKYRNIYANFVQYITGKRYEKNKNKWEEVKKDEPNAEIFSQFKNDDKKVRDYIKKMMGRLTFLCFLQRKGWMNNDRNFLQNLYQTSSLQTDFLDSVLEPLFFGVLNTPRDKRKEVFTKNGWNTDLAAEWGEIPYLNGGLFEQSKEDKLTVKFPKELFHELFEFLGEYNFTIDENDPDDAEIGIDPEMLGRVFESLLEDNKDKGAFYTPKEIVQYMCRQSIIEYLKVHITPSLHGDIEDLINKGLVNHALQNKDNAKIIYKLLKEVTVCDPAIGSGAFPMGILNILFTARQHLYGFLKESEPFNPIEVKKAIIRDNIYGVDIEQGAVDIARLRFWLAILVEELVATPLPNLDYRIVRGNSLITTFNDEYLKFSEKLDGRTKLAKLKKDLYNLQNDLFSLNGDKKLKCEIDIKCKILEIVKVQLGIDKFQAQKESVIERNIFKEKKQSSSEIEKIRQAESIDKTKGNSIFDIYSLITSLTTPATPLIDRAQIDIKFFDWKIIFSNIFSEDNNSSGFDIVIGNPPYIRRTALLASAKVLYEDIFESAKCQYDIYLLFIEMGINILKSKGYLCYIHPLRFFNADYGIGARRFICNNSNVLKILDVSQIEVFKTAMTYPCILLLEKNLVHSEYAKFIRPENLKSFSSIRVEDFQSFPLSYIYDDAANRFLIGDKKLFEVIHRIERQSKPFSSFFNVARGLANNKISFSNGNYEAYKSNNVKRYWIEGDTLLVDTAHPESFADEMIIMPRTVRFLQATIKPQNIICLDRIYYLQPLNSENIPDLRNVLGVFNSKIINFWFEFNYWSSKVSGNYFDLNGMQITSIPFPSGEFDWNKFTTHVQLVLEDPSNMHEQDEIDKMLLEYYAVSDEDLRIIKSFMEFNGHEF